MASSEQIRDDDRRRIKEQAERDAKWLGLMLLAALSGGRGIDLSGQGIAWNLNERRFYVNGRPVPIEVIRGYLTRIETRLSARLIRITDKLTAGGITIGQWRAEFRDTIGSAHILAAGLALGSVAAAIANVTVMRRVSVEWYYIRGFADDLTSGKGISPGSLNRRIRSYLMAASVTYGVIEQAVQIASGKAEAMRIRRASESCIGCIHYAGQWMPIHQMPVIGSLQCGQYCRCYIVYR